MGKRSPNGMPRPHRRKEGRWSIAVELPRKNGRRNRKEIYGRTQAEARDKWLEYQRTAASQPSAPASGEMTFESFTKRMLLERQANRAPSTIARDESMLRLHVLPHIGDTKLNDVTHEDIVEILNIATGALGGTTRRHLHGALNKYFEMARKRRIIADNPVAFVERPRADEYEPDRLNFDDARAYLNAAEGDEFEAFFYVALATGMRLGEVLGLRWSNVDLERRTIAVRTSLGLGLDGKTRLGPTKTHRSSRNVYFHQGVAESLKRRKVAQAKARLLAGAEWAQTVRHLDDLVPNDLVFTNSMGEPLSRTNFTRTHHGRILKKAGLRRITFHELRHSFISLHNDLRTDVASVAQTVGHKDSTLTMRVYTHATEDVQRSAAASLEIALGLCSSESTSELREAFDQHSSV